MMTTETKEPAKEKENYSRLAGENKELRTRVETLERDKRHSERYSRLSELRKARVFDLKTEFEDVKDASAEAFDRHVKRITENYSRIPAEGSKYLPTDDSVIVERDTEQAEKFSKLAVERAKQSIKRGRHMSFDEALAEVVKESKTTAAN